MYRRRWWKEKGTMLMTLFDQEVTLRIKLEAIKGEVIFNSQWYLQLLRRELTISAIHSVSSTETENDQKCLSEASKVTLEKNDTRPKM